jgi:hypothetical protein
MGEGFGSRSRRPIEACYLPAVLLPNADNVIVPEGHSVTAWVARPTPGIECSGAGLVLAHFGLGGDDPDEIFGLVDATITELERKGESSKTEFVDDAQSIGDLFVPAKPKTRDVGLCVMWTVRQDGLAATLHNPALGKLLVERLGRAAFVRQWVVVDEQWRRDDAFESALRALEIEIVHSTSTGPFLVEVWRPDGRCICGLVRSQPNAAAPGGARSLHRAPRLRRHLLEALSRGASTSFYDELLAREFPLLFFADANRAPRMMGWPGQASPFLPVLPDLASLHRASQELGLAPGSFAVAALRPRELFQWASQSSFGVALGVYADEGQVRYLALDAPTIGSLIVHRA